MGLSFKPYRVQSASSGESLSLMCQSRSDAIFTGAELLDVEVDDVSAFILEEWDD